MNARMELAKRKRKKIGATMDPEKTMPPRAPNTPRNALKRALAWAKENPAVTVPVGTFLLGVGLAALLF